MITPDTAPHLTPFNAYDPLSVGFMSQGQMGYMPQQQYLTPAEYGAFRTLPTNNVNPMYMQRPGILQNMMYANGGYLGGIPVPTYNPAINMMHRQEMARRGMRDQLQAYGTNALDAAMLGLGFINPAFGLASMVMPNFGAKMADIHGQMRGIQNMSIPKITFGSDVSHGLGVGFSSNKALSIEKFIRGSAAGDAFLKVDDYREIMNKGMEYNMFDYSNSAESYKKVIKRLRNQTDVMLEIIDDKNIAGVMQNLKRLQDMGASGGIGASVARQEGMFARMTGMRHTDMVNTYGQQGALIYSQYGMTGYQGALSAMGTAAQLTAAQRMGLISPDLLARNGGISGFTQRITEEGAAGTQRTADFFLPFLANKNFTDISSDALSDLMSGKTDWVSAMTSGAGKAGSSATNFSSYQTNKDQLLKNLTDKLGALGEVLMKIALAQQYGQAMGIKGTQQQVSQGLQSVFGYSPQSARTLSELYTNKEFLAGQAQQVDRERQLMYAKGAEYAKDTKFWAFKTNALSFIHNLAEPYYSWKSRSEEAAERENSFKLGNFTGITTSNTGSMGYTSLTGGDTSRYFKPVAKVGELPSLTEGIGAIARKYESRGRTDVVGYDKEGGTSYGLYQISSKKGTMNEFIKWLEANGHNEVASELKAAGPSNTGSTQGKFVDAWKRLDAEGKLTAAMQEQFIHQTHFGGAYNRLKDPGLKSLVDSSEVLQAELFSTAVHSGAAGGASRFNRAYTDGMGKEDLVRAVFAQRRSRISKGHSQYKSLMARLDNEEADVLAMVRLEDAGMLGKTDSAAEKVARGKDTQDIDKYTRPEHVRAAYESIMSDLDSKIDSKESINVDGVLVKPHNEMKDRRMSLVSAMNFNESDTGIDMVAMSGLINKKYGKTDLEDFGAEQELDVIKEYLKIKNPGMSDKELDVAARKKLGDPNFRKAVKKAYGMANVNELNVAKAFVGDYEKERMTAFYTTIQDRIGNLEGDITKITGSYNDTKFLLDKNREKGSAFHMVDLQTLLTNYATSNESNRGFSDKAIRDRAAQLGLSEDEVAEMLRTGDLSTLKSSGYSKEDLERFREISKNAKGIQMTGDSRTVASRAAGIAATEATYAGMKYITDSGVNLSDLYSKAGRERIMGGGGPDDIKQLASKLEGAQGVNYDNPELIAKEIAQLVPMSKGRVVQTGAVAPGDEDSLKANGLSKEFLDNYLKNLEKNSGSVDKLTTATNNLATVITDKGFFDKVKDVVSWERR